MKINQQCEISRLFTGSNAPDELILREVSTCDKSSKIEACRQIDVLLKVHDAPFDKAFPVIKKDFLGISEKHKVDAASLFWLYMDWKKEE